MDVAGFLIATGSGQDVLVTISPSSLGLFDQPTVKEQIDGCWIDMRCLPHRTWSDRIRGVAAVWTYLQGLAPISSGFPGHIR